MSHPSSPREAGGVKPSKLVPFLVPILVAVILFLWFSLQILGFYTTIFVMALYNLRLLCNLLLGFKM